MNKQKKMFGRVIAFLLAVVMVCSSFGTSSITAYAAGATGTEVIVEDVVTTETESTQEDVFDNENGSEETFSEGNTSQETASIEEATSEVNSTEENTTITDDVMLEETLFEDVVEEELGYIGEVVEEWCGPGLNIDAWQIEDAGLTVSDNAIISILEAQEQKFSVVSLNMNTESTASANGISAELWNALVGVLDSSVSIEEGWTEIRFNISGDSIADENWNFARPTQAESNVEIDMTWEAGAEGEGINVSFINTEFPADEASVNINTDENKTDYATIVAAMSGGTSVTVYDVNGNEVEGVSGNIEPDTFEEGEGDDVVIKNNYNLSINSIANLTANTAYTVKASAFKGRIDTYDDGTKSLRIHPGDAGKEYFLAEDIIAALKANEDGCVDEIYIEYPTEEFDYFLINDNIINESLRLFRESERDNVVIFAERNNNAGAVIEYKIVNPYEDESVEAYNAVSANMVLTEETATVSVHVPEFSAERVDVYFGYDLETEENTKAINLFGDSWKELELAEKQDVICWYDSSEEWGSGIGIDGVNDLIDDTEYTLKNKIYRGVIDNWDGFEVLRITYYDAGKEEALTNDEIKEVLAMYEGVSFNEVVIEQPYDGENPANNVIDAEIINEATKYLKEPGEYEDVAISFVFSDAYGSRVWRYVNPNGTADAGSVSANAVLDVHMHEEEAACIEKYGSVSFNGLNTKCIDLEFTVSHAVDEEPVPLAEELIGMFGEGVTRLKVEGNETEIEYRVEEHGVIVHVFDSERLENNTEYTLVKDIYNGIVEDNVLYIYPWHFDMYGMEYTEEAIVAVLQNHVDAEEKYARVEVGFIDEESDSYTSNISKNIYNVASKLIDKEAEAPADGNGKGFKYILYKPDGPVVWHFLNPSSLSKNIEMKYWIGFDDNGNVNMTVNIPDLSGTRVNFELVPNTDTPLFNDLMERLGDGSEYIGYSLYPVAREIMYFNWEPHVDGGMQILINGIDGLEDDKVYEVNRTMPGNTWTDETENGELQNLYVSADELGLEKFSKGDIKKYLFNRAVEEESFDCIYIEQEYGWDAVGNPDNTINKDDYNYIRENLLNTENSNASIIYVFDMSTVDPGASESEEDDVWLQQQIRYEFMNPSVMTKDIDASFNPAFVETYKNGDEIVRGGIDVELTSNTYPASGVNIQIHADGETFMGKYMVNSLGDPMGDPENPEDDGILCCILKDKKTLSDTVNDTWFNGYESEGRRIHMLHIGLAQNIPAKTNCRIYPVQGRGQENPLYVGRKEILEPCVSGNNLLWKSLTPQVAKVEKDAEGNYYIEPIMEGTAFYAYYCMTEGDTPIVEIFGGRVEKKTISMKFANASETKPLEIVAAPKGADWVNSAYLDLRFFPTGTGVDDADLDWFVGTVSDNSISANCITLVTNDEGNETGEIIAVEEGEAIVIVTSKTDPTLIATANVIVKHAVEDELEGADLDLLAIVGYDKTLADIEHLLPENMKWVDGKLALADYKDNGEAFFNAIYTSPIDERSVVVPIHVVLKSLDSIVLSAKIADGDLTIYDGAVVDQQHNVNIKLQDYNQDNESTASIEDLNMWIASERTDITLKTSAVSNPKNILTANVEDANAFVFIPSSDAKGKKTFTLSLDVVNMTTNKVTSVVKRSMSVYVPGKPVFDWDEYTYYTGAEDNLYNGSFYKIPDGNQFPVAHDADGVVGETGVLTIVQSADQYYKISAKSLDTSVCKLGSVKVTDSEDESEKITTIKYEIKNGGRAYIQLTAADEIKSAYRLEFDVLDIMPKVATSAGTIDTTRTDMFTTVNWQIKEGTDLDESQISLSGKDSEKFNVSVVEQDTDEDEVLDTASICIRVKDEHRNIKTGKYKLDVSVPVTLDELEEVFTTTITVTVVAPKNPVKVKQTKKPNLFYEGQQQTTGGLGYLEFSESVDNVIMTNQDGKLCDYYVAKVNEKKYEFSLKKDGDPKNTNARLVVNIDGLFEPVILDLNLKTENKKPSLVTDPKSVTLYPNYDTGFRVDISLKEGGAYSWEDIQVQDEAGNWISLEEVGKEVVLKNNTYILGATSPKYGIYGYALTDKKATDTLKIRIKGDGWSDKELYLPVSCKIKVDPSIPKLVADNKTLTLNKNDAFYATEIATSRLSLKDGALLVSPEGRTFDVIGLDDKSINALNSNLNIDISDYYGNMELKASFNGKDQLEKTSYKYRVILHQEGYADISTDITVKVVDTPPAKALTVSAKGSIDVLSREDSAIMYTAKLKDVNAEYLNGGYLIGPDADKFYVCGTVGNTLVVKTLPGVSLSTKQTYYVTPVFVFENINGNMFEVEGKQQKIKVKEGKAKVTVTSPNGNVLYRDRNNELQFILQSNYKNNPDLTINRVELVNYTNDLQISYTHLEDGRTIKVSLSQESVNQIVASGKSWNLKFNIYFDGKAINTKPTQVTYKMVVK